MASSPISFTVTHRGTAHPLSLLPETTLASFHATLEELTGVPPSLQKLLYKGKKNLGDDEATILQAGIKNGLKIQMLGSTLQEISGFKAEENEQQRKNRILRERAMKAPTKVLNTDPKSWYLCSLMLTQRPGPIDRCFKCRSPQLPIPQPRTPTPPPQPRRSSLPPHKDLTRPSRPTRNATAPILRRRINRIGTP